MADRRFSDVGGTSGGLGHFLMGFVMTCIGAYLLTNQVSVVGSYWSFSGGNSFGISLMPCVFEIAIVCFNGRSTIGLLLTVGCALFIRAGVIANMHIYFQPATLFHT